MMPADKVHRSANGFGRRGIVPPIDNTVLRGGALSPSRLGIWGRAASWRQGGKRDKRRCGIRRMDGNELKRRWNRYSDRIQERSRRGYDGLEIGSLNMCRN